MEENVVKTKLDSSGRLVIPAKTRRAAGIKKGDVLIIASHGEVILRQVNRNKKKIQEWQKGMLSYTIQLTKGVSKDEGKWVSRDYARRKLGL